MAEKEGSLEDSTSHIGVLCLGRGLESRLLCSKRYFFDVPNTAGEGALCDFGFPARGVIDKRFFIFDQFFQHLNL